MKNHVIFRGGGEPPYNLYIIIIHDLRNLSTPFFNLRKKFFRNLSHPL